MGLVELLRILHNARAESLLIEGRRPLLQILDREVCQQVLLRRDEPFQFDGSTLTWWTIAGGRINQTLKYAFGWKGRWKVTSENTYLEIKGNGLSHAALSEQLDALRAPEFWSAPETRQRILALVPEYRLSKFKRVLPGALQVEMVGDYLVDFDATAAFSRATANGSASG